MVILQPVHGVQLTALKIGYIFCRNALYKSILTFHKKKKDIVYQNALLTFCFDLP